MHLFTRSLTAVVAMGLITVSMAQQGSHDPLVGKDVTRLSVKGRVSSKPVPGTAGTALVLFDSAGSFGWAGNLYARQLANLLTHFNLKVTLGAVEQYKSGQLSQFDTAYYLGFVYDNPLPAAFKADVLTDTKAFCWAGFNLWQVAWQDGAYQTDNPAFVDRTGIRFVGLDETGYPIVTYKGFDLVKEQNSAVEGQVQIVSPTLATTIATSSTVTGESIPYITRGGAKFWYVADNPFTDFSYGSMRDRMLAFSDVLHDITGISHAASHRAIIRIEDVAPDAPPATLRAIADTLAAESVPFEVCVIPEYVDPLGFYNDGVPEDIKIKKNTEFVKALQYMVSKGGQIIMHGVTHQYSNIKNADSGVSGDDFEFFRVGRDSLNRIYNIGPVAEDSASWVKSRVAYGKNLLSQAGFSPTGWNTPHYTASSIDYDEFALNFQYSLCRALTFTSLPDGTMAYLTQFSPFTFTDDHLMFHIPETIGYVDPWGTGGFGTTSPADMQLRAHANLCVRDGWAGGYFHWFLPVSQLKDLVQRVKSEGYRYVPTSKTVDTLYP